MSGGSAAAFDPARAVLIVGAGPAGIAAALWLHGLELSFLWVDAGVSPGGTLHRVGNPIRNAPGRLAGTGAALRRAYRAQLAEAGIQPQGNVRLGWMRPEDDAWRTPLGLHRHVLLATGTAPRALPVPGLDQLRGVEGSVTRTRHRYRGAEVAVVGGGDAALEGALLLAEVECRVHLIHRRAGFRGQARFAEAVRDNPRIHLHLEREVTAVEGEEGRVSSVHLSEGEVLRVSGLFVRIGVGPTLPTFPEEAAPATERGGYLRVDAEGRTSRRGLWAAGDVASAAHQSVAWAAGSGARAAAAIAATLRAESGD